MRLGMEDEGQVVQRDDAAPRPPRRRDVIQAVQQARPRPACDQLERQRPAVERVVGWRQHPPLDGARAANGCLGRPPSAQDDVPLWPIQSRQRLCQQHGVARDAGRIPHQPRIERDHRPCWLLHLHVKRVLVTIRSTTGQLRGRALRGGPLRGKT